MTDRPFQVWVDVGGTFTDCILVDPNGERRVGKTLSSGLTKGTIAGMESTTSLAVEHLPDVPNGFWAGFRLRLYAGDGSLREEAEVVDSRPDRITLESPLGSIPSRGDVFELVSDVEAPVLIVRMLLGLPLAQPLPAMEVRMGTTRGTNALLTRSGARTGFVTTLGFGDCLEIGEQDRDDLFAIDIHKSPPLYESVVEIDERITTEGTILTALDGATARKQLETIHRTGIDSLAICLLNSYRNPVHELQLAQIARDVGFAEISCSHEVAPLIKLISRAETTVLDAYLNPILRRYISRVESQFGDHPKTHLWMMTSEGRLVRSEDFRGRDSLLSGPAGGVIALSGIARSLRNVRSSVQESSQTVLPVVGLDMGGTSTDVSRFDGDVRRTTESRKAGVRVLTPTIAIHTIAAGGGSVCKVVGDRLLVGPESAGADPGPACYGRRGPLAVTDLNLVLGRLEADQFPFQLDQEAAIAKLREASALLGEPLSPERLAEGFWRVAVASMAEAVRAITSAEGVDPRNLALVGFGGAAGQHICGVAEVLGIRTLIDRPDGSVLSALGMGLAEIGYTSQRSVVFELHRSARGAIETALEEVVGESVNQLSRKDQGLVRRQLDCRYAATDSTLTIDVSDGDIDIDTLRGQFQRLHQQRFGFIREGTPIEAIAVRATAAISSPQLPAVTAPSAIADVNPTRTTKIYVAGNWIPCDVYPRSELAAGMQVCGPAKIVDAHSTFLIEPGWTARVLSDQTLIAERDDREPTQESRQRNEGTDTIAMEIFARRLQGIADSMGEVLRRTAISVNVKERRDYSCAVFDGQGALVANAPHVPVHLGAMGHTVRHLMSRFDKMQPGDCFVTNDPFHGGSHLPDITLMIPVFIGGGDKPDFYVANRAHHAEIGGRTPGSMPPDAQSLSEEGVLIQDYCWNMADAAGLERLRELLSGGDYPSRNPDENIADILAQQAAAVRGIEELRDCCASWGVTRTAQLMAAIQDAAERAVQRTIARLPSSQSQFTDSLDGKIAITVELTRIGDRLSVRFHEPRRLHPGNFNAPRAICTAALLYVLRLLSDESLPLCEGALRPIDLEILPGMLDPAAVLEATGSFDRAHLPAVVAGNVETSQRIVDCLLGALGAAAASQGTMNNLLLGDATFGYYETICGGAGATSRGAGASAVHTHMTNTRITDPEILEHRLPVRLRRFSIRSDSGGSGVHRGGDGVQRHIEFLSPLTLSLITTRRGSNRPYGIEGGGDAAAGENILLRRDGTSVQLPACCSIEIEAGDLIKIHTPGGGGWGQPTKSTDAASARSA